MAGNKWQQGPPAANLPSLWHAGNQHHPSALPGSSTGPATAFGASQCELQTPGRWTTGLSLQTPNSRHLNLTLLDASMNFTPLYVMDSIMVGIFFICSVDFFRNKNIQVTVVNKSSFFHRCPTKAGFGGLGAGGGKPSLGGSRG